MDSRLDRINPAAGLIVIDIRSLMHQTLDGPHQEIALQGFLAYALIPCYRLLDPVFAYCILRSRLQTLSEYMISEA